MKTNLISKENNRANFTMDFTAEEFESAVIEAYKQTKDQFRIDGFRKGKAPRSVIERNYGENVFFEDAINGLFRTGYPTALKELGLEVIDMPKADFSEVGKGKPLTVTIDVPIYPVVEVKDYKGVKVEKADSTISEEMVDSDLETLQNRNARMVVAERPVQEGDTIYFDYAGFVGEEQFEGGTAENATLKIGSGQFIPGFEDQLVGAKAGEEVEVKVTFPETYHSEKLAGQDAVFKCKIHEVKEEQLPKLDDEFAMDVSEFDTLKELREDTRKRLQETADHRAENDAKDKMIDTIAEANPIDVPQVMVEDEVNEMIRGMDQQMRYQGLTIDQYVQFTGVTMEDFRKEMEEEAKKRVASRIILRSIGAKEKIEITEEDVEKELSRMAEVYKMDLDGIKDLIGEDNMEYFKKDIMITKVINYLYDNAKVSVVKPEKKTTKKAAEKTEKKPTEKKAAEKKASEKKTTTKKTKKEKDEE